METELSGYPPLSVVIATLNEQDWLVRTARSIRENEPADIEIVHVDDASEPPEPDLAEWDVKQIRLPRRVGAARARAHGMLAIRPESEAAITVDSHELFGPSDALGALMEDLERRKNLGLLCKYYRPPAWQVAAQSAPAKVSTLGRLAAERDCIAYMGPQWWGGATLRWRDNVLRMGWYARCEEASVVETAAAFGGNYAFSRNALERIGGYPQLPGYFGAEEEIIAFLAAAHRIPILCATGLSPWHLFRSRIAGPGETAQPYTLPQDCEAQNLAAVYRLAFGEEMWRSRWRKTFATTDCPRCYPIPEYMLRLVETPNFTAYRDALQSEFQLRDEALLEEVERRIATDLRRRQAQGPREFQPCLYRRDCSTKGG